MITIVGVPLVGTQKIMDAHELIAWGLIARDLIPGGLIAQDSRRATTRVAPTVAPTVWGYLNGINRDIERRQDQMHEWGLLKNIIKQIEDELGTSRLKEVKKIKLEVGQLSSTASDQLKTAFESHLGERLARDAKLEILEIAAEAQCRKCGNKFNPDDSFYSCPECNSDGWELLKGSEIKVESIEVE